MAWACEDRFWLLQIFDPEVVQTARRTHVEAVECVLRGRAPEQCK